MAVLGVLLLVGLLLMLQAGDISWPAPAPQAAAAGGKDVKGKGQAGQSGKSGKSAKGTQAAATPPPPLFVMAAAPAQSPAAGEYLDRRSAALREEDWRIGRTRDAFGYMDESAAAQVVAKLDDQHAYDLLSGLDFRALGRILEAAPPDKAAAWTRLLLERGKLPAVPDELRPAAADRGMYDSLDGLLKAAGYAPDGTPLAGGGSSPPAGSAPAGAAPAGAAPGQPGSAPTGAGGGSAPPPAGNATNNANNGSTGTPPAAPAGAGGSAQPGNGGAAPPTLPPAGGP
jgi:hypothetical protein